MNHGSVPRRPNASENRPSSSLDIRRSGTSMVLVRRAQFSGLAIIDSCGVEVGDDGAACVFGRRMTAMGNGSELRCAGRVALLQNR